MNVEYGEGKTPNLIEDIVPPHHTGYIDVRDPKVRYQSIGHLDEQYLRSRNLSGAFENTQATEPIRSIYTRIPPIETWPSFAKDNIPLLALIAAKAGDIIKSAKLSIADSFSSAASEIRNLEPGWLPKKYSALKGSYTDWDMATLTSMKWFAPAIILALIIIMLLLALPDANVGVRNGSKTTPSTVGTSKNMSSNSAPVTTASNSTSSQSTAAPSGSSGANSGAGLNASGNNLSGVNSSGGYSSLPYVSNQIPGTTSYTPSYITGGYGGGSAGGSVSPTGTSASVTPSSGGSGSGGILPQTVTVPSVNTSLGGKTLLNTSGPTLTVN